MKKFFLTALVCTLTTISALAQLSIWYNGQVVYQRNYSLIDSITFALPQNNSDGALSPEQTKEHLMDVAKQMVNQFNTADQKAAIDLADELYIKYKDYSWDTFEERYDERFGNLFRAPRNYMQKVIQGKLAPTAVDQIYTFGFKEESAIFEADEQNRTWKHLGASNDNSIILRFKDSNGTQCEAKVWSQGTTKEYEYTWETSHWEAPKVYATESTSFYSYDCYGYYEGEGHYFYKNDDGRWYYYDYNTSQTIYINNSDDISFSYINAYSDDGYYYFDVEQEKFFYYDWDNEYKVSDGNKTVKVTLPEKIFFTLKQGNTEIIRLETEQDLAKNNHAYFSSYVKLSNLSWTSDVKVNSTNGSAAFAFYYDKKKFFSGAVNLPVYELIDKEDNQSYEDWIEQYEERYEELLKKIGDADAIFDLYEEVQIKAKINNFGYAYRDFMKWDETTNSSNRRTKNNVTQFCSIFNDNSVNGIYYNSDIKQAEVRVIPSYDEIEEEFYPEAVLYFPQDGTSYGFEQYFDRKPFTDLQYMVEDVINEYIKTSKSLYDEIGDISFD